METNPPPSPWPDPMFNENQKKFTWEMLQPYFDQHVAWSWDGSRILAADPDLELLYEKLKQAGIDFQHVVFDYVYDHTVSSL